jgi:hypothetical protein
LEKNLSISHDQPSPDPEEEDDPREDSEDDSERDPDDDLPNPIISSNNVDDFSGKLGGKCCRKYTSDASGMGL